MPLRTFRYGVPFLFLAAAPLGFVLGGAWSFFLVALTPVALCLLDGALGSAPGDAAPAVGKAARGLPRLYLGAQLAVTAWAALTVADLRVDLVEKFGLTLSVGLAAGVFGMVAAHEMIHSPSRVDRLLGLTFLASVGYMHFRISHVHGHHRRAATREDPATSRLGEGAYAFVIRSIGGQAQEAWAFEARRLRLTGRAVFGPANRLLLFGAIELGLAAAVAAFSLASLAFFVGQALLAIFLLELFNYIAHYGLERARAADGRPARMGPEHSWNAGQRMTNWSLFNMGRHSDHHRRPGRPYGDLEPLAGAPELPAGYAGALLMALVPPLWRRVMDPRAAVWR